MSNRHSLFPAVLALLFSSSVFSSCTDTLNETDLQKSCASNVSRSEMAKEDPIPMTREDIPLALRKYIADLSKPMNLKGGFYRDSYFFDNLCAINDLPFTILAEHPDRNANPDFNRICADRAGATAGLSNVHTTSSTFTMQLKTPWMLRYPCRFISNQTHTPLCVGRLIDNSYALMTAKTADPADPTGCDWCITPNGNGSAQIANKDFTGQSDPDNIFSVFHYVLEPRNGFVGFGKPTPNNSSQNFLIVLEPLMSVMKVDFDLNNASVAYQEHFEITKVSGFSNTNPYQVNNHVFEVEADATETSRFTGNQDCIRYNLLDNNNKVDIILPTVVADKAVLQPQNALHQKSFAFWDEAKFKKKLKHTTTVSIPGNTYCELTTKFKTFVLNIPYTVELSCIRNGRTYTFRNKGEWRGYVVPNPSIYKPIEEVRLFPLDNE